MCVPDLSTVRHSWVEASLILFWASQCSMSEAGTPSMAKIRSPAHRLARAALLPGVIYRHREHQGPQKRRKICVLHAKLLLSDVQIRHDIHPDFTRSLHHYF